MSTVDYSKVPELGYEPQSFPRELCRHYIAASDQDIAEMMKEVGVKNLEELYTDLPNDIKMKHAPDMLPELSYGDLQKDLYRISQKNNRKLSFIGDGLQQYKEPASTAYLSGLRGLTTAYTPYQPERSQGTLESLWIYSSTLSMLTGFEAVNASLYDRSTAIFEACNCALRLARKAHKILISEAIYPGDLEVMCTMAKHTQMHVSLIPFDRENGISDLKALQELLANDSEIAGVAFPQVNCFGLLEDVDAITDLCRQYKVQSIGIIDPILLSTGGLKPPSVWGQEGADMFVGEGQHLALAPNMGGPGLGIFGIRYNAKNKNAIRSTAGRFIGKACDEKGAPCKAMVLSTREQHIRREKATSNICSNQSFIATLAGAGVLWRGEKGMTAAVQTARENALYALKNLLQFKELSLRFANHSFFNEFVIEVHGMTAKELHEQAAKNGIQLGVRVAKRLGSYNDNLLLLSFSDIHDRESIDELVAFLKTQLHWEDRAVSLPEIESHLLRKDAVGLPNFSKEELKSFYQKLSNLNVSPDEAIYPLGSCTMKYNPYINDWAASLPGFTNVHPEASLDDLQGSLEILYQTQEMFKKICGLPGITTQPLAGAQGEIVGIKLFRAYHEARGEAESRNVILIPHSAHGTNPATAATAGFDTKVVDGKKVGIVLIDADECGRIDVNQFKGLIEEYGTRIAGMMVTNPNTSGIFEVNFKELSDLIHSVGGLVYMDGANMNAIAGWLDLGKMGVDAVHNNLHKTWSISHGGGGPGDGFVAVSEKLIDFLPGVTVVKEGERYSLKTAPQSIGSIHRHFGNFAHKIRAYTYLRALGGEGVRRMSAIAVLSAKYLHKKLAAVYPTLPFGAEGVNRMHEFILTISQETFDKIEAAGVAKNAAIVRIGKLFLDYGFHAPTVAFPEVYGLMIEPTESYTKAELDRFAEIVTEIHWMINNHPEVLATAPHFTPVLKVNEVEANKNIVLAERIEKLPELFTDRIPMEQLRTLPAREISMKIVEAHNNF